ncbi:MAG: peptidoglycan-binding protein [Eubacteriales bacterium]
MNNIPYPVIPETITVHLGAPQSNAQNITVSFPDYIKNVASSEVYPTWPDAALRANIYAQISFAMNRIYTEYYRAQGYDFDITNSTAIDQSFVNGRDIFENVSQIVDEIFNSYIRRRGSVEPLFAAYCNGTTSTCDGLSQWGTVPLAEEGFDPYDILTQFYGEDIEIVQNVPVENIEPSLPAVPLALGSSGNEVRDLQVRLNRISTNYPAIPKIYPVDGIFGKETEDAVRTFQSIFGLTVDGIVGRATWYRILFLYNGIKRLNELTSEGITAEEVERQFGENIGPGSPPDYVRTVQYYLALVGYFNQQIDSPPINGIYDERTETAVRAFQTAYGLPVTGIVDLATWEMLYDVYVGLLASLPDSFFENIAPPFPGIPLRPGTSGEEVVLIQQYLNVISSVYPEVPSVEVSGYYGPATVASVEAFQRMVGITPSGITYATTWQAIADTWQDIEQSFQRSEGQYPGSEVG